MRAQYGVQGLKLGRVVCVCEVGELGGDGGDEQAVGGEGGGAEDGEGEGVESGGGFEEEVEGLGEGLGGGVGEGGDWGEGGHCGLKRVFFLGIGLECVEFCRIRFEGSKGGSGVGR